MHRVYLMPMVGSFTKQDPRRAKYRDQLLALGIGGASMHFGRAMVCLWASQHVEIRHHQFLSAQPDCFAFPANLDTTVGNPSAVRAALDSFGIPSNWVLAAMTWREVLRRLCGMFQFMQELHGQNIVPASLDEALPLTAKTRQYRGPHATVTIRAALMRVSDDSAATPFLLRGDV